MKETTRSIVYLTTGIVIGGAGGYFVTKKLLEAKYENEMNIQIQDVKDYYRLIRKEDEFASPETVPVVYNDVLEGLEYIEHADVVVEDDEEETVDEEVDEEETVDEEVDEEETESIHKQNYDRDRSAPYIISIREYMEDRDEYDKTTITYFEDDDVLCDEREEVIPNVEGTVGSTALTNFGHLSEDKKIVYVRNERISTDFEIVRDTRSYAEVVLGFKEEKEVRKMRGDD
jgi:hypothetical protein